MAVRSNRLKEFRERAELTQQALADKAGTGVTQIVKLERGERRLTLDWAVRLAPHLGCEPLDLLPPAVARAVKGVMPPRSDVSADSGNLKRNNDNQEAVPVDYPRVSTSDRIPIRSAGRGGKDQEMYLHDGPVGYTQRPANLVGVKEAYAIYHLGESMRPRYFPGWILHVNPFKPPSAGRDVVIYKTNDAVLIKEFVELTTTELVVASLHPERIELRIPRDEVREYHLIVGSDQEG